MRTKKNCEMNCTIVAQMFQAGNFCVGNTQSWALALDSGHFWILHRICLIFWFWISAISLLSHWLKTKFPGFWLALQGISHKDEINLQIKKRSRSRVDIYLRPLFRNISVANYKIFSDLHNWKKNGRRQEIQCYLDLTVCWNPKSL